MNQPELCARVATPTFMSRTDAATAVGAMFATISDSLASGETVLHCGVRHVLHRGPLGSHRA